MKRKLRRTKDQIIQDNLNAAIDQYCESLRGMPATTENIPILVTARQLRALLEMHK